MAMDFLPDSLLLQILSQLDDSSAVARIRVASKSFNTVFPYLGSINLQCSWKWYLCWSSTSSPRIKPFKLVFLNLISKQKLVESICIRPYNAVHGVDLESQDLYFIDDDFVYQWLPRVSKSLKSLSISNPPHLLLLQRKSNVLPFISANCHNLVNLELKCAPLSLDNLNPMPLLTSLTLECTNLEDGHLNEISKCFPNLQVLNLVGVRGLKDPKIHLLNLKTCVWTGYVFLTSLTLITPNLTTLRIEFGIRIAIHVEAPMLSDCHLGICDHKYAAMFTINKFENLKTLWLESYHMASLLSKFPTTTTVENLTLDSRNKVPSYDMDSKLTLGKVFAVFPNVSFLCIKSGAWWLLEACLNPEDWEILDGRKGLKTFCAYLILVDPLLTFTSVACVLDKCVGLSKVSLLINADVVGFVLNSFMSKCMARWPGLKWRWGIWRHEMEDSWITDGISNQASEII